MGYFSNTNFFPLNSSTYTSKGKKMAHFLKALRKKKGMEENLSEISQALDEKNNNHAAAKLNTKMNSEEEGEEDLTTVIKRSEKDSDKRFQECTNLVKKATEKFRNIPLLTNNEIKQMYDKNISISKGENSIDSTKDNTKKENNNIILVDCRSQDEIEVSMMPNAISEDEFNNHYLTKLTKLLEKEKQKLSSSTESSTTDTATSVNIDRNSALDEFNEKIIISYCTVGYRSGVFAKKLLDLKEELNSIVHDKSVSCTTTLSESNVSNTGIEKDATNNFKFEVYNSEGIVKATWDGIEFITRDEKTKQYTVPTKTIHTYGKTWDFARSDYKTVQFKSKVWNFLLEPVISLFAR